MRVRLRVVGRDGRPVAGAQVTLITAEGRRVSGRTHGDGRWDLYPEVVAAGLSGRARVVVEAGGLTAEATVEVPARGDGQEVELVLPGPAPGRPAALELAFAIDATGSMSDELMYLEREVAGIVRRVRAASAGMPVRLGAVAYRDRGDQRPLELAEPRGYLAGKLEAKLKPLPNQPISPCRHLDRGC